MHNVVRLFSVDNTSSECHFIPHAEVICIPYGCMVEKLFKNVKAADFSKLLQNNTFFCKGGVDGLVWYDQNLQYASISDIMSKRNEEEER